jgi:hypothetical protein
MGSDSSGGWRRGEQEVHRDVSSIRNGPRGI